MYVYSMTPEEKADSILVVGNGSQFEGLYVKRLRDLRISVDYVDKGTYYDEKGNLVRPSLRLADVKGWAGLIFTGGKSSVLDEEERVDIDPRIYTEFDGPILGTCYGHHDIAVVFGGKVEKGFSQCGPVFTDIKPNLLFEGLSSQQRVNATHSTGVSEVPPGFEVIASSTHAFREKDNIDAMYKAPEEGKNNPIFTTQFHPETFLTENGNHMLMNFLRICGLDPKPVKKEEKFQPNNDDLVEEQYEKIKEMVGDRHIFLPISGGVDSTVATQMLLDAGVDKKRIHAFHIDTGFNRLGESEEVVRQYHAMGWNFVELLDKKEFIANFSLEEKDLREDLQGKGFGGIKLKDAVYSEHKRVLFQSAYAQVFEDHMKTYGLTFENSICVQGTNQADKVESQRGGKHGRASALIKTHHNVGRIFDEYKKAGHLLEPLEVFFKSDIYHLARGLPEFFSTRRPFPGPGLLIRIGNHDMVESGRYTKQDLLDLTEQANAYANKFDVNVDVTPLESVGTFGDERAEGVMSFLHFENGKVEDHLGHLRYVAGQLPHYTTFSHSKCITRFLAPLFDVKGRGVTKLTNTEETVQPFQIFDHEINKIIDELGIQMTQIVNYVIQENLGEEGKYTFVLRPW